MTQNAAIHRLVLINHVEIVVIPHSTISLNQYEDLYGLRIGKMRGVQLNTPFNNDPDIKLVLLNNYLQAHTMLKHNRLDAIAGSVVGISHGLLEKNLNQSLYFQGRFVLEKREKWLQMSKQSAFLNHIEKIEQAAMRLSKRNTLNILKAYHIKNGDF